LIPVGGNVSNAAWHLNMMFTFQPTAAIPTPTIGLIVDNIDNAAWDVPNVGIEGPGAITANQAVARNGAFDLVQFDIIGGAVWEIHTVYGTAGASGALMGHQVRLDPGTKFVGIVSRRFSARPAPKTTDGLARGTRITQDSSRAWLHSAKPAFSAILCILGI
jgi:hypothetical protein